MNQENYIITIGRQLGSGGAALGQMLSEHFGFTYINKEVLLRAAAELEIPEENVEQVEERPMSVWEALRQSGMGDLSYASPNFFVPTGGKLYETQTKIIKKAADEGSCVVIGRCGSHIFRGHPRHASVFIHAKPEYRLKNIMETMQVSEEKARKEMDRADKERARYFNTFTGRKWLDLREYDYCVDAGHLDMQELSEVVIQYIGTRFPELVKE